MQYSFSSIKCLFATQVVPPLEDQDMEVQQILHTQLGEHLHALDGLVSGDLADLNALLRSKGLGIIGN